MQIAIIFFYCCYRKYPSSLWCLRAASETGCNRNPMMTAPMQLAKSTKEPARYHP